MAKNFYSYEKRQQELKKKKKKEEKIKKRLEKKKNKEEGLQAENQTESIPMDMDNDPSDEI